MKLAECHNGFFVRNCYTEKCVMNNYFGIGLDAKISLDFNNKRDEHPKKCRYGKSNADNGEIISFIYTSLSDLLLFDGRSRTKNMMWYGVLGTKELLQRTYKNLEQKVLLEVSAIRHCLPVYTLLFPFSISCSLASFLFSCSTCLWLMWTNRWRTHTAWALNRQMLIYEDLSADLLILQMVWLLWRNIIIHMPW